MSLSSYGELKKHLEVDRNDNASGGSGIIGTDDILISTTANSTTALVLSAANGDVDINAEIANIAVTSTSATAVNVSSAGGIKLSGADLVEVEGVGPAGVLIETNTGAGNIKIDSQADIELDAGGGFVMLDNGTAAQASATTDAVTINAICGKITTFAANTAGETYAVFTVNNSKVAATDHIFLSINAFSGATDGSTGIPYAAINSIGAGSFTIIHGNQDSTNAFTSDNMVLSFFVVKAS